MSYDEFPEPTLVILEWTKLRRPDVLSDAERIFLSSDRGDTAAQGMMLLALIAFAAGREYGETKSASPRTLEIRGDMPGTHRAMLQLLGAFLNIDAIEYEDRGNAERYTLIKDGGAFELRVSGNQHDGGFMTRKPAGAA